MIQTENERSKFTAYDGIRIRTDLYSDSKHMGT